MNDLIRKSDVNDVIDELEVYVCGKPNTTKVEVSVLQLRRFINKLKNIPIAYSVDKVIEELENEKRYGSNYDSYYEENLYCGEMFENGINNKTIDNAIEIVKHSGVDDDVCEWTQSDDMAISPHTFSKYKIKQCDGLYALSTCPYCRKKIKVVE